MRVTTAFNRLLQLQGAWVRGVRFAEEGIVCEVALRRRRRTCSGCGKAAAGSPSTTVAAPAGATSTSAPSAAS